MSTDRLKAILFAPLGRSLASAFQSQRQLAEALSQRSGQPVRSFETGLSRLVNHGYVSNSLSELIVVEFTAALPSSLKEAERKQFVKQLEDEFKALLSQRVRERSQPAHHGEVGEMAEAVRTAASLFATNMLVTPTSDAASLAATRRAIVQRFELDNDYRPQVFRIYAFPSLLAAYEFAFALLWDSVALCEEEFMAKAKQEGEAVTESGQNGEIVAGETDPAPTFNRDGKAEQLAGEIETMQSLGLLDLKVLRLASCLVSAVLANFRPPGELEGFIWSFDQAGKVKALRIHPCYLGFWRDFISAVRENDPEIVRSDFIFKTYRNAIIAGRVSPPPVQS